MTQEEKLEEAKRLYKTANADQKYVIESLFPELKESEDERIRKKLIEVLNLDIIGAESQMRNCSGVDRTFEIEACKKGIAWLEKQGEQKSAEWSEIDKANLEDSIYFVKEFRRSNLCDNESRLQNSRTCIEWLASLKDRVLPQPMQGWSEEDRKIIIELIGIFESAIDGGHVSFPYRLIKDYIRVLKLCLPQTTWKPSEEQMDKK